MPFIIHNYNFFNICFESGVYRMQEGELGHAEQIQTFFLVSKTTFICREHVYSPSTMAQTCHNLNITFKQRTS